MNPTLLPPGQIDKLDSLALERQLVKKKLNTEFKTAIFRLTNNLVHISVGLKERIQKCYPMIELNIVI